MSFLGDMYLSFDITSSVCGLVVNLFIEFVCRAFFDKLFVFYQQFIPNKVTSASSL